MKKIIIILAIMMASRLSFAQNHHTIANQNHAWVVYNGDHKINPKWGVHIEAQVRRHDYFKDWQQLLLRTGINYHASPSTMWTVGYCFVETHPYGLQPAKSIFPEHRIWEQFQIKTPINKVEWVSRFRLEQRLANVPVLDSIDMKYKPGKALYTNRARLMNKFSKALLGEAIIDKSLYLVAYDELFVNFGKNIYANLFDQNRAFVGLGYKIPKIGRLEAGYLNQSILKSDGVKMENNNTLLISLNANFDLTKTKK